APTIRLVAEHECPTCEAPWREPHKQECRNPYSERLRSAIYLMWRGGLRGGCELVRLYESDLHPADGYMFIERGKNGKSRDAAMDDWVWQLIQPWIELRQNYPAGPLFCTIDGVTSGRRAWLTTSIRKEL